MIIRHVVDFISQIQFLLGGVLTIAEATTIDVIFDPETKYRYDSQQAWKAEIDRKLPPATRQGFEKVKKGAIKDDSSLLGRASLNPGKSADGLADLPTDERVLHDRSDTSDIQLSMLVWSLGRHVLIAASREHQG